MAKKDTSATLARLTGGDLQMGTAGSHLPELQAAVLRQMHAISNCEKQAAIIAIIAGITLHKIKAGLAHGKFLPWVNDQLGKSRRQASNYMRLALVFVEQANLTRAEVGSLPSPEGEMRLVPAEGDAAASFLDKATSFVGDRSLNEILCAYGIKNSGKLGGLRELAAGGEEPAPSSDPEQLYLFARDEIGGVIERAETLFLRENRLQYLIGKPEEIRGAVAALRALADKVEAAARPLLAQTVNV